MNNYSVSVVLATYNGEDYIHSQLLSIVEQSISPTEVVISDDCSTDGTVHIISEFIEHYELQSSWKLVLNNSNKGYINNFIDCFRKASGDIIFFCDQDDIWKPDRIAKYLKVFNENQHALAVSSLVNLVDECGNYIERWYGPYKIETPIKRVVNRFFKSGYSRVSFKEQVNINSSSGSTLAVRKDFFYTVLPVINKHGMTYDLLIGLAASIFGGYYIINESLLYYRIHRASTSTPNFSVKQRLSNIEKHISGRQNRVLLMEICLQEYRSVISDADRHLLEGAIRHTKDSICDLKKRSIWHALMSLFTLNPMISKKILIVNVMFCIKG